MKKIDFLKWRQLSKLLTLLIIGFTLLILPNIIQAQNNTLSQLVAEKRKKGADFEPVKLLAIDKQNARRTNVKQWVADETLLQIDPKALSTLRQNKPRSLTLTIPNNGEILELELVQQNVVTEDFVVKTKERGRVKVVDYDLGIHYRGIIKGQTQSMAAISIFDDRIIGGIFHGTKQYTLAPVDDREQGRNRQHIFYEEANLKIPNNISCHTDEMKANQVIEPKPNFSRTPAPNPDNCVNVYFECTHKMYLHKESSVDNTVDYVIGMYNQVISIYQQENINTKISEIVVWIEPEPYRTDNYSNTLADFRTEVGTAFNGDIAHLLTTGSHGYGGIAGVDALCKRYKAHAYSNIFQNYADWSTYSRTVFLVAHEIGHNLGSRHTHNCVWNGNNTAIDGCGPTEGYIDDDCEIAPLPTTAGTIMSYCYLIDNIGIDFSLGFGEQPGDLIRDRVYNAVCLDSCGDCPEDLNITQTYSTGKFSDVEASNQIRSISTIESGANVTFDAGLVIYLRPGFQAHVGSEFRGIIDGCGGSYKTGANIPRTALQAQITNSKPAISDLKCYPNPFSESTILNYTLNKDQKISLSIFNPNGQEVARLLENANQIAGSYEITFEGQNLPKGLYFYRFMDGEGNVVTGKMGKF